MMLVMPPNHRRGGRQKFSYNTVLITLLGFMFFAAVSQFKLLKHVKDTTIQSQKNSPGPPQQIRFRKTPEVPIIREEPLLKEEEYPALPSSPSSLNLIDNKNLAQADYFSDSWLLSKNRFLEIEFKKIITVEDACFAAIGKRIIKSHSKMFVDWTDFMVEHMSHWWKVLGTLQQNDSAMLDQTVKLLKGYYDNILKEENKEGPLHPTIALIAFSPYRYRHNETRGYILTASSLAATISSLYQIGLGRVVVVGYSKYDSEYVTEAFRLLMNDPTASTSSRNNKIGNMELAYVRIVKTSWVKTRIIERNIPRGAIVGMQMALNGDFESPEETQAWLGTSHTKDYWKYFYLTEPDTILHTKSNLLDLIRKGLDEGLGFYPHRLQPLPHQSDLPRNKPSILEALTGRYVPSHEATPFANVTTLTKRYSCCDDGPHWHGRMNDTRHKPCRGQQWWGCGLLGERQDTPEKILRLQKRLLPYPLMRLEYGTRIVFLSTNQGRRCIPSTTPCGDNK